MVVTTSHSCWSSAVDETPDSNKLAPGAKVMLFGLLRCTLTYQDQSWPDQSQLNGAIGYIMRRESNYWIVQLASDQAVKKLCLLVLRNISVEND